MFIFSSKCSLTQLKVPLDPLALFTTGKYKLEWKFAQIPMTTWFYLAIFFFIHSNRVVSSISSLSLFLSFALSLSHSSSMFAVAICHLWQQFPFGWQFVWCAANSTLSLSSWSFSSVYMLVFKKNLSLCVWHLVACFFATCNFSELQLKIKRKYLIKMIQKTFGFVW